LTSIPPSAIIGAGCRIVRYVSVGNDVELGDRVTIRPGAYIGRGARIGNDVWVDPNATLVEGDSADTSRERIFIERGVHIGANATILPGITVGRDAKVLPGAVVTRNVPPLAIVAGNPAVITGYMGAHNERRERDLSIPSEQAGSRRTRVSGVTLHRLPSAADMRGQLAFGEVYRHIPFEIKRLFFVYAVPNTEVRGEHAHYKLHQFILCVHGRCSLMVDDGTAREEFILDEPTIGVHLPPLVWGVQYKHTPDAVQVVMASDYYDAADYIRTYEEFLNAVNSAESA
jgi:serine acetyltransferase